MLGTTQNPIHQDNDTRASRVRALVLLSLVRLLAGRRGHARVSWWGQGFRYTLSADRVPPEAPTVDADPQADPSGFLWRVLRGALARV